jgi:16S rRNA (cytosine967-C5)-methyltransferase
VPAHAAVSTTVELARQTAGEGAARFVNQALRKLAAVEGAAAASPPGASHPDWLVRRWTAHFGEAETGRLLAWNDAKPPLTLQPARWDQETLLHRLRDAGFGVTEAPFGAGVRLTSLTPDTRHLTPADLPGFAEGGFFIQDAAQALIARFAAFPRDSQAYDACAAPGGKAVALERGGARVLAGDASRERVPRLRQTATRCGVAIRTLVADLEAAPFAAASLPAVFLDAPCTATGTMARHPDARWRLRPGIIRRAAARQRRLLAAAAALVAPGGVLVYATCSLEPEENLEIVEDFLERHPPFARAGVPGAVAADLVAPAGDFASFPPRHGMDGAFAARLVRTR